MRSVPLQLKRNRRSMALYRVKVIGRVEVSAEIEATSELDARMKAHLRIRTGLLKFREVTLTDDLVQRLVEERYSAPKQFKALGTA
jgi:hypothetical protein